MNTMKFRTFARVALWAPLALVCFAGGAQAAIVDITGGASISTPSHNNVLGAGYSLKDNAGVATTVANVAFQFYFLGSESGFVNTLHRGAGVVGAGAGTHAENNSGQPGVWPGTLLFSGTTGAGAVANANILYFTSDGFGGNLNPAGGSSAKSIALAYLNPGCLTAGTMVGKSGCVSATEVLDANGFGYILFALDDSGAGPDDNHDDYVGYMRYHAVPIPAAAWLLGSGLIGLVGLSRRRRVAA